MEPQQVVARFLQLPVEAQRVVAELVAYLDRREAPSRQLAIAALVAAGEGAIILPPLAVSDELAGSSEHSVASSASEGVGADWEAPTFDFREWRRQIWERPKAQL